MSTLIVAFPKIEEAKAVRSLLVRRGYDVAVPCTSGAQAINQADNLSDGIIICGYKLSDNMLYSELYEYKPKSFEILLVASQNLWEECHDSNVVCVAMPIKVNDLLSTIEIMQQSQIRRRRKARTTPRKRSQEEQKIIDTAKHMLMEKNNIKAEANMLIEYSKWRNVWYLQKCTEQAMIMYMLTALKKN